MRSVLDRHRTGRNPTRLSLPRRIRPHVRPYLRIFIVIAVCAVASAAAEAITLVAIVAIAAAMAVSSSNASAHVAVLGNTAAFPVRTLLVLGITAVLTRT